MCQACIEPNSLQSTSQRDHLFDSIHMNFEFCESVFRILVNAGLLITTFKENFKLKASYFRCGGQHL
jgi:hypothetical protein